MAGGWTIFLPNFTGATGFFLFLLFRFLFCLICFFNFKYFFFVFGYRAPFLTRGRHFGGDGSLVLFCLFFYK